MPPHATRLAARQLPTAPSPHPPHSWPPPLPITPPRLPTTSAWHQLAHHHHQRPTVKMSMQRARGGAVSVDQWPPQEEVWETRQCLEPSLWGIKYARRKAGSDTNFAYYCGQHRRRWPSCVKCNPALRPVPLPDTPATFTTTSHNDGHGFSESFCGCSAWHTRHHDGNASAQGGRGGRDWFCAAPRGGQEEALSRHYLQGWHNIQSSCPAPHATRCWLRGPLCLDHHSSIVVRAALLYSLWRVPA